jgi:hypothetical protein
MPHHAGAAVLSASRVTQYSVTAEDTFLDDPVSSETTVVTLFQLIDVDRDGLVDLVDVSTDQEKVRYGGRVGEVFGYDPVAPGLAPHRPGLLWRVTDGAGGVTGLEWAGSATQGTVGEVFGTSTRTPPPTSPCWSGCTPRTRSLGSRGGGTSSTRGPGTRPGGSSASRWSASCTS